MRFHISTPSRKPLWFLLSLSRKSFRTNNANICHPNSRAAAAQKAAINPAEILPPRTGPRETLTSTGSLQFPRADIPCGLGEFQMLFFISAHGLKVYPARYGKFGEVIIHAVRDSLEANYSHFLGTIVVIVVEETSNTPLPVFFVLFCFILLRCFSFL